MMIDVREWFETVTIPVGGGASWCDGALRLWLDRVELIQPRRGRLARWFRGPTVPVECWIAGRVETPAHPCYEWDETIGYPVSRPRILARPAEDRPLLAPERITVFELCTLAPADGCAVVRAGRAERPMKIEILGELAALDAPAQRFVRAWLELPLSRSLSGEHTPARIPRTLEGYSIRHARPGSTGLLVTFHRDGDHFFVRAYGGCGMPRETWFGPFVVRGGTCELAGPSS